MQSDRSRQLADQILELYQRKACRIVTAESCTGGLLAATLIGPAGASNVIGRGFVTYSNIAKREMLGVSAAVLAEHGAVSERAVRAMAEGALVRSGDDAQIAISISGVAGPGGGSSGKPVGTVYFGLTLRNGETSAECQQFDGDRDQVRLATVEHAMEMLLKAGESWRG